MYTYTYTYTYMYTSKPMFLTQQPAASSQQPYPAASSQQPAALPKPAASQPPSHPTPAPLPVRRGRECFLLSKHCFDMGCWTDSSVAVAVLAQNICHLYVENAKSGHKENVHGVPDAFGNGFKSMRNKHSKSFTLS